MVTHDEASPFLYHGRILFERFLGFMDREPTSPTYGCFDRNYWHYKMHDFPNLRLQEAAQYLVIMSKLYPEWSETLRPLVIAAVRFWSTQRHREGCVDEAYPWERSFCATAMSMQAVTETILWLEEDCGVDLLRSADWLAENDRTDVANQMAAAGLALYNFSKLTGDSRYAAAAKAKIDSVIDHQLPSGGYLEYSGSDNGYTSITLSSLTRYFERTKAPEVGLSIKKALADLDQKVDGFGNFDSSQGSRRTQFLYPYGLTQAQPLFGKFLHGLSKNAVITPLWMDDRYCVPLATDYLLTHWKVLR